MIIFAWALLGGVVGGLLGSAVADASAGHPGDIAALFGGLLAGTPVGALSGGLAGAALGRRYPPGSPTRRRLVAGTWIAPVVIVAAGWVFELVRTWDDLVPSGGAAWLWYEVSLPRGRPDPLASAVVAELETGKEKRKQLFPGHGVEVERRNDRAVIRGSFETYKASPHRTLRVRIGDGPTYVFELKLLPSRPPLGYSEGYSDWHGAARVDDLEVPSRAPAPAEQPQIRYKMDV